MYNLNYHKELQYFSKFKSSSELNDSGKKTLSRFRQVQCNNITCTCTYNNLFLYSGKQIF